MIPVLIIPLFIYKLIYISNLLSINQLIISEVKLVQQPSSSEINKLNVITFFNF